MIDDETSKESSESAETNRFMPFQIHGKMRLAPRVRTEFTSKQKDFLDDILSSNDKIKPVEELYLKQLKSIGYAPKLSGKTWPVEEEEKDIIIIGMFSYR